MCVYYIIMIKISRNCLKSSKHNKAILSQNTDTFIMLDLVSILTDQNFINRNISCNEV